MTNALIPTNIQRTQREAKQMLPSYHPASRSFEDALRSGAGNCYAHAEAVYRTGIKIGGIISFISLSKRSGEPETHTKAAIFDCRATRMFIVDNTVRNGRMFEVTQASNVPEHLVLRRLIADQESSIVIGAKERKGDWSSVEVNRLYTANPKEPELGLESWRAVMPAVLGLKVIKAVAEGRRIFRENGKDAFDEFTEEHRRDLPPFDFRPIAVN